MTPPYTGKAWTALPLSGFDLETTGPDPLTARIVSASVVHIDGSAVQTRNWLLDPGIEIPAGAAEVHGITTERARAEGMDYVTGLSEIRAELEMAWSLGRAVVIFNGSYDCTVMSIESARLGLPKFSPRMVIDPFVLDRHLDPRRPGSRRLEATVAHYGLTMGQAHTADADALAASRLAWVIARAFPEIAHLTGEQLMELQAGAHQHRAAGLRDWMLRKVETMRAAAARLLANADELNERADSVSGEWPIRGR
ncbi:exonuclease domain-containing protein [Nocardia asteroides]|uniref:exonuclease domain-containing protein n=1 Tax=Nocardia asteroides TaxID=1824 RepID=UPI0037C5D7E8